MPERSLMYFFSFETTIRSSRSNELLSAGAEGVAAGAGAAATIRGAGFGGGGGVGVRAALSPAAACSASQACRVGARASTAHESRWRRIATWLSQQATEQNTSLVRLRLHVDTLHTQ